MNLPRLLFLCSFLCLSMGAESQNLSLDTLSICDRHLFPDSVYRVMQQEYRFHSFHISLINVHPIDPGDCHSFILITRGRDTVYHKCFPLVESLGGCAGVYSSDSNKFEDYFFISKFGDYNGRLIILNRSGKVTNISGSSFYISKNHEFIFANQDKDINGLTIWNLAKSNVAYDSEESFSKGDFVVGERFLWQIRYDKNYHYLLFLKDIEEKNDAKLFVLKFDNLSGRLTKGTMDSSYLLSLESLSINNASSPVNQEISCFCGKPGMH